MTDKRVLPLTGSQPAGAGGGTTSADLTSQKISVLSQAISVVSQAVSVVSTAASNALSVANAASNAVSNEISNRTSADNVLSNAISVVSQALSALSQTVSVADAALSVRIDTQSQAISTVVSGASVRSVGNVSTHGIQSILNALSNRISAGTGGSVTPTSAAFNTLSNAVSVISQQVSVLSQQVSLISARVSSGVGLSAQTRVRGATSITVSATTLTDIPSLSVSCAAGGVYEVRGGVNFEALTSGGFAIGFSTPALGSENSYLFVHMMSAQTQNAPAAGAFGRLALSAVAAGQNVVASISIADINSPRFAMFEALLYVSAAGSFQVMARVSTSGVGLGVLIKGGYIRAFQIG